MVKMGKRAVAVSLGLTYSVVMLAWGFAFVKMASWLQQGLPQFAHFIGDRVEVGGSGRPALVSSSAAGYAAINGLPTQDCDPTEPTHCVFIPVHTNRTAQIAPRGPGDQGEAGGPVVGSDSRDHAFAAARNR